MQNLRILNLTNVFGTRILLKQDIDNLHFLNLTRNNLSDYDAKQIFEGKFKNIKELILAQNNISKVGFLDHMKLRLLDISRNPIEDFESLPSVKYLRCDFEAEGATKVEDSRKHSKF